MYLFRHGRKARKIPPHIHPFHRLVFFMRKTIFALGFFDGVHLGHQALLSACRDLAAEAGACPGAITFDRHPMAAFTTEYPPLLTALADRKALLSRYGMERILVLDVASSVMSTSWEDFLRDLTENHGALGFVCGDDFRFGVGGTGNSFHLARFCAARGLPCRILPEQRLGGQRISSTHIRRLLEAGDLAEAERFLGHPYFLTGAVVHGRALGRTIGVPTANLSVENRQILPKNGVYACLAHLDGLCLPAVTNVGTRPTVSGAGVTVESWIQDFSGDLYGRELTLEFLEFLRPESKFDNLTALQAQIVEDAQKARTLWQQSETSGVQ